MTRPKVEMQGWHDHDRPPRRSVWRWAFDVIAVFVIALALMSCATVPAQTQLVEVDHLMTVPDGFRGPDVALFTLIAGPGCKRFGDEIVCPDRGTGWQFAGQVDDGRITATWMQRNVR